MSVRSTQWFGHICHTGAFRALEDSITRDLDGGPGSTGGPDTDRLAEQLARMDRLIGLYQQQMRLAQR